MKNQGFCGKVKAEAEQGFVEVFWGADSEEKDDLQKEEAALSEEEQQKKTMSGTMVRIYLDNCCYNRPYDDQSQIRISLEAQAKLHIQNMIEKGELELVSSYMLDYEVSRNPYDARQKTIRSFIDKNAGVYVDKSYEEEAEALAEKIKATGVKSADAIHTACALIAECDYMLSTDDRLLKFKPERMKLVSPVEFI